MARNLLYENCTNAELKFLSQRGDKRAFNVLLFREKVKMGKLFGKTVELAK